MKVYIVNKSAHDFSSAMDFGELIFLSEGPVNRYATNNMMRIFTDKMKDSSSEDHIVLCSLNVMNSIACSVFVHKHGRLNLLLFKDGHYIERNLVFNGDE